MWEDNNNNNKPSTVTLIHDMNSEKLASQCHVKVLYIWYILYIHHIWYSIYTIESSVSEADS